MSPVKRKVKAKKKRRPSVALNMRNGAVIELRGSDLVFCYKSALDELPEDVRRKLIVGYWPAGR